MELEQSLIYIIPRPTFLSQIKFILKSISAPSLLTQTCYLQTLALVSADGSLTIKYIKIQCDSIKELLFSVILTYHMLHLGGY